MLIIPFTAAGLLALLLYIAIAGETHRWLSRRETFSDTDYDVMAAISWPGFWAVYGMYRLFRLIVLFAWGLGAWCFGLFKRRNGAELPKAQVVSK